MLKVNEILQATQGRLVQGEPDQGLGGVSINSRTLTRKDAFIAIRGHRFDGHRFIQHAVRQGAGAVIVSRPYKVNRDVSVIHVKDTTVALGRIAAWHRQKFNVPVIAITGSAGKTSTKEYIATVLASQFQVLKNVKSENNHIGVPLTLLKLRPSHSMVIVELGTNRPGDIAWLSEITRPTMAVFTNIGDAHLQGLRNKSGVFHEKKQIIKYLPRQSPVVINADDPYLRRLPIQHRPYRFMTYSIERPSDYQARSIRRLSRQKMRFTVRRQTCVLPTAPRHNIYNALAAICCGRIWGIRYNVIKQRLRKRIALPGRQKMVRAGGIHVIDDTYNANPLSLNSAVRTLDSFPVRSGAHKILICADMLELGHGSRDIHEKMAQGMAGSTVSHLITKGNHARVIAETLRNMDAPIETFHGRSFPSIYKKIGQWVSSGDVVLVKGSRSMKMEKVVHFLQEKFA